MFILKAQRNLRDIIGGRVVYDYTPQSCPFHPRAFLAAFGA